jgi:hypothetical protein
MAAFIALDVDDQVRVLRGSHLSHAIGPRQMIRTCTPDRRPEATSVIDNTVVIRRNHQMREISRLGAPFVDMLKHAFTGDRGESFSRES